jgi:Tfp pilus assembly protein PilZ
VASISTRTQPFAEAVVVNLSEGGVGLRTNLQEGRIRAVLSAGEEIGLRFELPGTEEMLDVAGTVVWTTAVGCGVRFGYIPEAQRSALQQWLTECVERSLTRLCERIRAACA